MFLNPAKIVEKFNMRPGMKVADFGCGSGHFSIEMGKRTGKSGTVFAFDIKKEALSALKSQASAEHLTNIEFRRVDLEEDKGTKLMSGIVDFVLLSNILFQVEDKKAIAREAFRILKPKAKALVIDWDTSSGGVGPPKDIRVEKSDVKKVFTDAGFSVDRDLDVGESHFGILFKK